MTARRSEWLVFPTVQGYCGVAWCQQGLTAFLLPEQAPGRLQQELVKVTGEQQACSKPPAWIRSLVQQVKQHLKGVPQDFSAVPVHIPAASDFMQEVYRAAQGIPAGEVCSYAGLAERMGNPGAVRAVGTALGKNPVPLIIPCHRVISASGKLGGFSANGGLTAKRALLDCEGISLDKPSLVATPAQWREAVRYLQRDKALAQVIRRVGDIQFCPQLHEDPLAAFIDAIVSQQLSTKVAATILQRVHALVNVRGKPSAKKILALPDEALRGAGLSGMKVAYLKDLAQHSLDGKLPTLTQVRSMSDEQLVRCFTAVKGIGRWSVEMYLIFDLGRADVFPVDDYGIRKAVAQMHGLPELPTPKAMAQYGKRWQPYRTVASLYLWRSLDNG